MAGAFVFLEGELVPSVNRIETDYDRLPNVLKGNISREEFQWMNASDRSRYAFEQLMPAPEDP